MLRVEDLHHSRRQRASVNHESYKLLLHKLYARIRHRASVDCTEVSYPIPPLIPGRPIYSQGHAARYITDKLEKGGFRVENRPDDDATVLHVSWPPARAVKGKKKKKKGDADTADRAAGAAADRAAKRPRADGALHGGGKSMSERLRELSDRLRKS